MYEIDGICYAGNPGAHETRIIDVKPLVGRMLLVTFDNGEGKLFDTTTLQGPVFDVLDDPEVFRGGKLFHGVPTWDDGNVDVAPEYVYEHGDTYNTYDVLAAAN